MTHPLAGLDEIVHQRTRLGVLAILNEVGRLEFGTLRDQLAVSDGNLSQHLRTLEGAGLVTVEKGYQGRRPRTWLSVTPSGSQALGRELELLRHISRSTVGAEEPSGKERQAKASRPLPRMA